MSRAQPAAPFYQQPQDRIDIAAASRSSFSLATEVTADTENSNL
jgi:hypothetical protein